MSKTLIGIDFETTGTNHNKHVPLSLGLAWVQNGRYRTEHITFNLFSYDLHDWTPEAMIVNGMYLGRHTHSIDAGAYMNVVKEADYNLFNLLTEITTWTGELVPTGWNVYGFDMRFLLHYFPKSAAMFYYSSRAELNTMCTMMDRIQDKESGTTKNIIKKEANQIIEEEYPKTSNLGAHNAEYDALLSLICYEILDNICLTMKPE